MLVDPGPEDIAGGVAKDEAGDPAAGVALEDPADAGAAGGEEDVAGLGFLFLLGTAEALGEDAVGLAAEGESVGAGAEGAGQFVDLGVGEGDGGRIAEDVADVEDVEAPLARRERRPRR